MQSSVGSPYLEQAGMQRGLQPVIIYCMNGHLDTHGYVHEHVQHVHM